jgi:hypothetical protein
VDNGNGIYEELLRLERKEYESRDFDLFYGWRIFFWDLFPSKNLRRTLLLILITLVLLAIAWLL